MNKNVDVIGFTLNIFYYIMKLIVSVFNKLSFNYFSFEFKIRFLLGSDSMTTILYRRFSNLGSLSACGKM